MRGGKRMSTRKSKVEVVTMDGEEAIFADDSMDVEELLVANLVRFHRAYIFASKT